MLRTVALAFVLVVVASLSFSGAALYGLSPIVPQLVRIDPLTAQVTPIGNANLPNELTGQQLSSIDTQNRIYYLVAFNQTGRMVQLLGLSLVTGKLVLSTRLPFAPETLVGVGQTCNVIPGTGDVLVSGRDGVRNLHQILRVNPRTGHTSLIAKIGDVDVLGGASAYDPANNILWIQLGTGAEIDLFGFNINTGQQVYQIDDSMSMETMNYDPVTKLLYGIGLKVMNETSAIRILVTLDSKTGKFNEIGTIPGYFIIEGGVGALNPTKREVYCFLQKTGSSNQPFLLVTVDMNDATVKHNPVACRNPSNCPWSMGYQP